MDVKSTTDKVLIEPPPPPAYMREPGPSAPPHVKPRARVKQVGPRYIPPRYIPPRVHRAPPNQSGFDFETEAVHKNLRPAE